MNHHDSHHNEKVSQDRREVCGEPRERTHPATDVEGEAGVGSSSESAPALTPEKALRFEWFHECKDCGKRINTRWKYCRRCVAKSRRKKVYPNKVRQSYACGCTSSSNRDVTAKD